MREDMRERCEREAREIAEWQTGGITGFSDDREIVLDAWTVQIRDALLKWENEIESITSQLKIAVEALEAISKHQKLSAGDMAGLSTTFVIANNALQKISEVK